MPKQPTFAVARHWLTGLLLWLALFAAEIGLLWLSGAFRAEFGQYSDEASHYVTSLTARDYIRSLASSPPMRFAEDYYAHYPRVAMGRYPPFLYLVEGIWTLIFPVTRPSLLLLNAVLTSLTAVLLCLVVRKEFGTWAGAGAGLLLMALPVVLAFSGMVMAEPLSLCLCFAATVCFGRYLETERWSHAAWFGVLASLAILTKQVTLFLGLVPPLALLLTRKLRLLRRFSFWLPALIAMGLALPWHVFATLYFRSSIRSLAGYPSHPISLASQAAQFVKSGGWALTASFLVGLYLRAVAPLLRRLPSEGLWAACASALLAFLAWQRVAPAAAEDRHLLCIEPVILLFTVAGVAWLAGYVSKIGIKRRLAAAVLSMFVGLAFGLETFKLPRYRYRGYAEAASRLAADPSFRDDVFLICADAGGEGAFIAELASREKRPGHIVLRGNRMLAQMSTSGTSYWLAFRTPAAMQGFFESVPVRVLVVETVPGRRRYPHEELAAAVLRVYPDRWKLIGSYPNLQAASPPSARVRAYRLVTQGDKPRAKVKIDLRRTLGRVIEY